MSTRWRGEVSRPAPRANRAAESRRKSEPTPEMEEAERQRLVQVSSALRSSQSRLPGEPPLSCRGQHAFPTAGPQNPGDPADPAALTALLRTLKDLRTGESEKATEFSSTANGAGIHRQTHKPCRMPGKRGLKEKEEEKEKQTPPPERTESQGPKGTANQALAEAAWL